MNAICSPFRSEADLVRSGRRLLRRAISGLDKPVRTRCEVPAPGAVPDLVIFTKEAHTVQYVITIEFKLSNWRQALHQAFRHRNFGNEAYVVLDQAKANAAVHHIEVFEKANIGLVTLNAEDVIRFWHFPEPTLPFSSQFSRQLARMLLGPREIEPADLPFTRSTRGGLALAGLRDNYRLLGRSRNSSSVT